MVKLKCCLVAFPSAIAAFPPEIFNSSSFSSIPSDFGITGTASSPSSILVIFEFIAAYFTKSHIF